MAGIRDVAKLAGVGITTVSRYLNSSGYVSLKSAEKIKIAIRELDYTPNELSRNLFFKRTGIVAVLVPYISHPFYTEFCRLVEDELYRAGYKTMICNTSGDHKSEAEYLDMLNRHIVDGIITAVHTLDVSDYLATDKPVIAMDRYLSDNIPVVSSDHYYGGELAAKHLSECGCKRVLQFQGDVKVTSPANERHISFAEVMRKNGAEVITVELSHNRFDNAYLKDIVEKSREKYKDIDGVFATDILASQFISLSMRKGISIPDDVNVIAYDGTYITELAYPKITAIVQPIDKIAHECVRLLKARINKKPCESHVKLSVTLSQGESTEIKHNK